MLRYIESYMHEYVCFIVTLTLDIRPTTYYGVWVELSIPASQHDLRLTIVKSLFSISHNYIFIAWHCIKFC